MSSWLMYLCAGIYLLASLFSDNPRMSVILLCYAIANAVLADMA
jgi:hypothetical protein